VKRSNWGPLNERGIFGSLVSIDRITTDSRNIPSSGVESHYRQKNEKTDGMLLPISGGSCRKTLA